MTAETDADDVERLRRVAFGRQASADERAAAVEALRQLRTADEQRAAEAAERARVVADPAPESADDESEWAAEPDRRHGIRPLWLIPIVVASIVVGAVGALAVSSQFEAAPPSVPPSQSHTPAQPPPPSGVVGGPGDLEAAERWFDGGATPSDAFPDAAFLEGLDIDQYDVRFMASEGSDWSVWVAKDRRGQLCLLVRNPPVGGSAASCSTTEDFERNGISIGLNDHTAFWDGAIVHSDRLPVG